MNNYFAYGSNLSVQQMKERCPGSQFIGKAVLNNYKLSFTTFSKKRACGCADVVANDGNEVWGLIYSLTEKDLEALDRYEGQNYRRIEIDVMNDAKKIVKALTYVVINKSPDLKPSKEYLSLILNGAKDLDFPENYINSLLCIPTL